MKVIYDPINSHTATHFSHKDGLKEVVCEALKQTELIEEVVGTDMDMKRSVGLSDVVEVSKDDDIYYAMRTLREDQGYVQFTSSKEGRYTNFVSIHLEKRSKKVYELMSCWAGRYDSPPFPQMKNATSESEEFWSKHAFIEGSQQIIEGTKRTGCPW